MRKLLAAALAAPLVFVTVAPASAQRYGDRDYNRNNQYYGDNNRNDQYYNNRYYNDQYYRQHQQFYNGAYRGGRDGDYGNERDNRYRDYDRRYHGDNGYYHQGGIGPGKGALIGGAGGAALGALFGGGAKGALLGGAAGAGIGALLGEQHQKSERRQDYYGR